MENIQDILDNIAATTFVVLVVLSSAVLMPLDIGTYFNDVLTTYIVWYLVGLWSQGYWVSKYNYKEYLQEKERPIFAMSTLLYAFAGPFAFVFSFPV